MATVVSELQPIGVLAGVQPATDKTASITKHFTLADKIRFRFGVPQKLGGWSSLPFEGFEQITGWARSIYSATISGVVKTLIGTHTDLYSISGQLLTNVTPLETTTHAVANSLATDYATLGNNPLSVTLNSGTITVTDTNYSKYRAGDTVTFSGSSAVAGIAAVTINTSHIIRSVGTGTYTVKVGTLANATTTGGGASVVRATGRITVTAASHGQANGDRTKILAAADTGGILAAKINLEFIIRNIAAGSFDIFTSGVATSSVSAAGGASTTYQKQIAAGYYRESFGQGYGMGLYGAGLYGVSKLSTNGRRYPRIWFCDRFAEKIIATAGNQTNVYIWDGSNATAPAIISGAPTAINYAFVSNGIVVTFGAGGIDNKIFTSDINNATQWVASSTNQVFEDEIEGAGRFTSHAPIAGQNLLFTEHQTYLFGYIGLPLVWNIQLLDNAVGIIAPLARCVVNGIAYWMGQKNFYMWSGSNVQIIQSNSQPQSTILQYVFSNLNFSQKSKCFCWYNKGFDEIWWHYPSQESEECDRIARFNIGESTWTMDTMDRTAAEYPNCLLDYPRLIDSNNVFYRHEYGYDDDTQPLAWTLSTNKRFSGKSTALLSGFVPDSIQNGDITVNVKTWLFPQSTSNMNSVDYTVTPTTEHVSIQAGGRYWMYTLSGSALGQEWTAGAWQEFVQKGANY